MIKIMNTDGSDDHISNIERLFSANINFLASSRNCHAHSVGIFNSRSSFSEFQNHQNTLCIKRDVCSSKMSEYG